MVNHASEIPSLSGTKRRKLVSKVWNEFTRYEVEDGKYCAICKHCKRKFDGSPKKGTTHLHNHLKSCRSKLTTVLAEKSMIDQQLINHTHVAKTTKHGITSLNSRKDDILRIFNAQKEELRRCFEKISCRFSLTIDRLPESNLHYLSLKAHFIDDDWKLKKAIISYRIDRHFWESLKDLLLDWRIDKNVCSIVAGDNDDKQDEAFNEIKDWLRGRGSLPFFDKGLHIGNLESIFEYTANMGSFFPFDVRRKIRQALGYIHKTSSNERKFQIAADRARWSLGKKVTFRNAPKSWISGFRLLEKAIGYKEAFCELEKMDPDFKSMNLTKEEWEEATAVYECMVLLNDNARTFRETIYTTSNLYFPMISEMFMQLLSLQKSYYEHVRNVASYIRWEFEQEYLNGSSLFLATAVVLDPRHKMDIVKCWYNKIYGPDAGVHIMKIKDFLNDVYDRYASNVDSADTSKTELHLYLKEPKLPLLEDFDILDWWHKNTRRFPTLAKVARDLLALPFSSAPDDAMEAEIENIVRSDLDLETLEAFICTKYRQEIPEK